MTTDTVVITIPSTIEQEGRALVAEIEAATKFQQHPANAIYERIWRGRSEEWEWAQWITQHCLAEKWQPVPRKSHVLPTEGGCSFDPTDPMEPREWELSRVERARERQFPGIHKRWYRIEGRGRSHWSGRHEDVLLTHAQVHMDLAGGPGSTIGCQFCMLSCAMQECGIPQECTAYVLSELARSNAAKTADLIAGWMEQRQIAKSPTP